VTEFAPEQKRRLLAAVRTVPSPTRPAWLGRVLGVAMFIPLVCAALSLHHGFDLIQGRPYGYVAWAAGGFALLAGTSSWLLLKYGYHPLGPSRRALRSVNLTALPLLIATTLFSQALLGEGQSEVGPAHTCAALFMLVGFLFALLLVWVLRAADPLAPARTAVSIGVCAAGWVGVAVTLQCPFVALPHVLIGHVLPAAALMLLLVRWGTRILGSPSAAR
jgi:hypothetical protein